MAILSENRKAGFDYDIQEKLEAGMVLLGTEVKSIRNGRIDLAGSYVIIKDQEPFLVGAKIPAYQPKNAPADYNPERFRKLLLSQKEISYLIGKSAERGLTLLPLKVYTKNRTIKLEIGVGKGKKQYDKREAIKKRETQRDIKRAMKEKN